MGSSSWKDENEHTGGRSSGLHGGTNRFQIHWEDVVEASAPLHFVAGTAVRAVELEVALLHAGDETDLGEGEKGEGQLNS